MKNNIGYKLYWEDVDERLVYAELDDKSWKFGEKLFGYKKANSLYIYHHGKLSAFYSTKDIEIEATVGYRFYSNTKNVLKVIRIKKEIKRQVDKFITSQNKLNLKKIGNKQLVDLMLRTLDYCEKTLNAHFLTQANFFEQFESEGGLDHVERFEKLSAARFEYSRKAWRAILDFGHKLFAELGRRNELSLAETESLTRSELIAGKINKPLLQKRSEKYVIVSKFHKQNIITGEEVKKYIIKYEKYKESNSVEGVIGNPGIVRAKAFVLKNEFLDLKNLPKGLKKGMVLIVQNAWPELDQYYKFASAIVTNEGGITSHGVIVAREFGIPCIVATRYGTKIFNTGDLVEVNANKGIVRKIK